ncbi:hypothetical protein UFOVP100_40 [uncultured Caudovirales phage]|uniref:Uncharacterized protein n=1 Tax=uncultured Caudovirales phage TaxID=2100421 RepID=A0A6J5L591_9CAUD|nr:hypothetical protein UFOVP100_40 [uncultured Caudovirales phage]
MTTIQNKWVEKVKKKRAIETAPAFESNDEDTWSPIQKNKIIQRHTNASQSTMHKTLRGLRK